MPTKSAMTLMGVAIPSPQSENPQYGATHMSASLASSAKSECGNEMSENSSLSFDQQSKTPETTSSMENVFVIPTLEETYILREPTAALQCPAAPSPSERYTVFYPFPKLPKEVRYLIWRLSLSPRVIHVNYTSHSMLDSGYTALERAGDHRRGEWVFETTNNSIANLQVCREARRETLPLYECICLSGNTIQTRLINFKIDTIYLNTHDMNNMNNQAPKMLAPHSYPFDTNILSKIQSLAIDRKIWNTRLFLSFYPFSWEPIEIITRSKESRLVKCPWEFRDGLLKSLPSIKQFRIVWHDFGYSSTIHKASTIHKGPYDLFSSLHEDGRRERIRRNNTIHFTVESWISYDEKHIMACAQELFGTKEVQMDVVTITETQPESECIEPYISRCDHDRWSDEDLRWRKRLFENPGEL